MVAAKLCGQAKGEGVMLMVRLTMSRMAERGRGILTHLASSESGNGPLSTTLILLILGALIIAPILAYMGTGLKASQTHERRTDELYAADSGINLAMWQLGPGELAVPEAGVELPQFELNDTTVNVAIQIVDAGDGGGNGSPSYLVTSIATSDTGSSTTIESYIFLTTLPILEYGIASNSSVNFQHGITVNGDVYANGDIRLQQAAIIDGDAVSTGSIVPMDQVSGESFEGVAPIVWPPLEIDIERYKDDARATLWLGDYVVPDGPGETTLGPLYITGNLRVGRDHTIVLAGTVYVEGVIKFEQNANLRGSGSLIGEKTIDLQQMIASDPQHHILVMSTTGSIYFRQQIDTRGLIYAPSGAVKFDQATNLVGGIIGNSVDIQASSTITYDLDDPWGLEQPVSVLRIRTYTIHQS